MESDKFYAKCWNKAKKDAIEGIKNNIDDEYHEGKLKVALFEYLIEFFGDVEKEVKEGR